MLLCTSFILEKIFHEHKKASFIFVIKIILKGDTSSIPADNNQVEECDANPFVIKNDSLTMLCNTQQYFLS